MSHNPIRKWLALGACLATGLVISMIAPEPLTRSFPAAKTLGVGAATLAVVTVAVIVWWRSLDELAQEAHKSAWYWGGSFGLLLPIPVLIVAAELNRRGIVEIGSPAAGEAGLTGMWLGFVVTAGGAILGYAVAWTMFWWQKR